MDLIKYWTEVNSASYPANYQTLHCCSYTFNNTEDYFACIRGKGFFYIRRGIRNINFYNFAQYKILKFQVFGKTVGQKIGIAK